MMARHGDGLRQLALVEPRCQCLVVTEVRYDR